MGIIEAYVTRFHNLLELLIINCYMMPSHCDAIAIVFLLLGGLSEASGYFRCYEGFNVTIGGIPFQLWRDQVCSDKKDCVMQEFSLSTEGSEFAGLAVRYGGCFSRKLQNILSCSPQKSHAMGNIKTKDVLDLLDERLLEFVTNIYIDFKWKQRKYQAKGSGNDLNYTLIEFFAEDNSIEEFCTGILNFLGLIGYVKQEIEIPFRDFVRGFGHSSGDDARVKLMKIMRKVNDATKTLSNSVLARARDNQLVDELPLDLSYRVKSATGMIYPVVDSLNSDTVEIFETVSECIKAKDSVPPLNSCQVILRYLAAVQLFASIADLGDINGTHKIIYDIGSEVSRVCSEVYYGDTEVKLMNFVIEEMRSIHQKAAECYDEFHAESYIECNIPYVFSMITFPLNFPDSGISSLKFIRDVLYRPMLYQKHWLAYIFGHTDDKSPHEEYENLQHLLKAFPSRSCQEYVCHSEYCNSHGAFVNRKDDHEMSDQEKMTPKLEL